MAREHTWLFGRAGRRGDADTSCIHGIVVALIQKENDCITERWRFTKLDCAVGKSILDGFDGP